MAPQIGARPQHGLVLGVECGAPADRGDDAIEGGLVLDQQVAGGGTHEHLDAGRSLQPLQRGELVDVLARGADVEGEIAEHAVARAAAPCRRALPRRS